jgi:hypothetical protein
MSGPRDDFERRLAEELAELADTALPGRRSVEDVAALAGVDPRGRSWMLPLAAAVVLGAVGAIFVVGLRPEPALSPASATPLTPTTSASPAVNDPSAFVELLRVVIYDYEPVDSPQALAAQSDLVVVGTIRSVSAGASLGTHDRPSLVAVLEVEVAEMVLGDPRLLTDGRVYVDVPRRAPPEDFMDVLPTGRVLLFLSDATDHPERGDTAGRPEGSRLFAPFVQGFWIESPESVIGVYADLGQHPPGWDALRSIDALIEAARHSIAE